jgi:hypothetical protein
MKQLYLIDKYYYIPHYLESEKIKVDKTQVIDLWQMPSPTICGTDTWGLRAQLRLLASCPGVLREFENAWSICSGRGQRSDSA